MIDLPLLHPIPSAEFHCPACQIKLMVHGWHMPGMRQLADLECPQCHRTYYGDLPSGHGLFYPALLQRETGEIVSNPTNWFSDFLHKSYASRQTHSLKINFEQFRPIHKPALLNCLEGIYGHSIEKILNSQYYLDHSDYDLILVVPRYLAWMIPQGVAAMWVVDAPLRLLGEWHEAIHTEIEAFIRQFPQCHLIPSLPEISPQHYQIERFTGIRPFQLADWHQQAPQVSVIWRQDKRLWAWRIDTLSAKAQRLTQLHLLKRPPYLEMQRQLVQRLCQQLSQQHIQVNLLGLGQYGDFSPWANDHRVERPDDATERTWLTLCAQSHVVISVHGSHLLLPSAHAGAVIDLMPDDRWGNIAQDIIHSPEQTPREAMARYHYLPLRSTPEQVAQRALLLIQSLPMMLGSFRAEFNQLEQIKDWSSIRKVYRQA